MKKILFMLLAVMGVFSSCSNKVDDLYNPDMTAALKNAQYNRAFLSQFGNIDPYHTWGFNNLNGRAVTKADETTYPSDEAPAAITDTERKYVANWFANNPGLSEQGFDFQNFFVQHVYGNVKGIELTKINKDPNLNGNWQSSTESYDGANMDALVVGDDKINDFNAASGGPFGIVYVSNGSANTFSYNSTYDNVRYPYYKVAEIDVPGVGVGYYVGLSIYGVKEEANAASVLGEDRKEYADNWIIKLVPTDPIERVVSTHRIIAEDLGEIGDFDFNDVVFDVELVEVVKGTQVIENYANITLLAAGGTLPLYIGAHEVHAEFGVETDVMVNTGMGESKGPVKFKLEKCTSPADIQISVRDGGKEYILNSNVGQAPMKICVTTNFEWPAERQNIKDKYPKFADYVYDQSVTWY